MTCPACRRESGPEARFCTGCGAPLSGPEPPAPAATNNGPPRVPGPPPGGAVPPPSGEAPAAPAAGSGSLAGKWLRPSALWFIPLVVGSLLGRPLFSHTLGTLFLLGITAWLVSRITGQLGEALRAFERWKALAPWWKVQARIPGVVRKIGGVVLPLVVAYLITPYLIMAFGGFGFLVTLTCVAINVLVADLLLRDPEPAVP